MNCLCCGKPIQDRSKEEERISGWHTACVRKFFGTSSLPFIDISEEALIRIAEQSTGKGYTVPGVQKKMSLHLSREEGRPRLTLVNYPTGFILKPQTEEYRSLPEAEFLVMQMADRTGIPTVPHALIRMAGNEQETAYITRRIDRVFPGKRAFPPAILAMEDFCQLEERLTENKYRGSYERCAKVILKYSSRPGLDLSELFLRVLFSFVTGNSDMHLKNFSLIETTAGSQDYVLSAAYDMLPVNVIVPEDTEQLALTLNGKKRNIHRKDFLAFADSAGITADAAAKMIRKILSMKEKYLAMCHNSLLPDEMRQNFAALIAERMDAMW